MTYKKYRIEDICEFIKNGKSVQQTKDQKGLPITRIETIANAVIDPAKVGYANLPLEGNENYLLKNGDILFSHINSVEHLFKTAKYEGIPEQLIHGMNLLCLRPNVNIIDPQFFLHLLRSDNVKRGLLTYANKSVNQASISATSVKNFEVDIPSLEEQRRIASILDEADAIRQKRQQAIAKLNELLLSEFLKKFSNKNFKTVMVQELLETEKSMRTGPFGSQLLHSEFVDEGIAVLGIDNAVKNQFQWGKPRFITEQKYKTLSRYTVKPNDVLITIMGTCGRCAVVPENIPKAINTKHLCCITLDKTKCEPEFLHSYFLMHPTARNYLESRAKGAIMDGLNMGIIKELPVELPSLEDQKAFVKLKKVILSQKQLMDLNAEKIDQMFGSLQQKAFSETL